jgi:hypothetical protein
VNGDDSVEPQALGPFRFARAPYVAVLAELTAVTRGEAS